MPHYFPELNEEVVIKALANVTAMFEKHFPGVQVFPLLGNHIHYTHKLNVLFSLIQLQMILLLKITYHQIQLGYSLLYKKEKNSIKSVRQPSCGRSG